MKNYLKSQLRRSLSLMLTVLMIMSCWVWIAPTEAEAGAPTNYDVVVTTKNENDSINACEDTHRIVFTHADGSTTEKNWGYAQNGTVGDETFTITKWPKSIYFQVGSKNVAKTRIVKVAINGIVIFDGGYNLSATGGVLWENKAEWTMSAGGTQAGQKADWTAPHIDSIVDTNNETPVNITLGKLGTADKTAFTSFTNFTDQYGVTWTSTDWSGFTADEVYFSTAVNGSSAGDFNETLSVTANKNAMTITAKADLQTQHMAEAGSKSPKQLYLVAKKVNKAGTTTSASIPVNFTYPGYNWVFDGTVQGSGDSKADIIMQDGSIWDNGNGKIEANDYLAYGQKSEIYPVDAKKEGFTFYGFWTKPQPGGVGAKGEPFALEAEFEAPISSNEYAALTPEQQEKYVDAGEKWDPKADSSQLVTEGDKKYYGWWLSDDINVKFYDINGKFLGEKNVKYGQGNGAFTWPEPTLSYSNGALSFANWNGMWENIDGTEVNSKSHTFTKDLILTPVYDTVTSDYRYNVTFYKANGTFGAPYSGEYAYRADANVPTTDIGFVPSNDAYTYEFAGWAVTAPKSGNYHIIEEDGDFDTDGNAVNLVSDFTVRSDVSYYPVFRRFIRSYDVTFSYKDSTGADKTATKTFKYGERITAPDGVPTEYATGGYGFTFLGWTKGGADVNLNAETCVPNLTYTAKYSEGVATPYTVTFEYRDEAGKLVTKEVQVNHGQKITQETVNSLAPATNYDNGEALVTYNGVWEYNGTRYSTAELTNFSPENHVTFKAVYENPQPFYTVTYVDGNVTKAYRVVEGTVLPFWTYETTEDGATVEVEYKPTRANTEDGKYEFTGWFDAQEGGTQYVPGETELTGNVTLYPQFSYDRFTYNIVFMNYDGTKELAKGTFYYGDSLENIINTAEAAAKGADIKPADDVYSYQFLGWDKRVPAFCEGGEPGSTTVFTAQYKPVYIYYNVEWYNDEASINATGEEAGPLYTSKYIYGDKIYTPAVELTLPEGAPDGQNYVFSGWFYKVGGTEYQYVRGVELTKDIMTDSVIKMYAKYELTDKTYTVTVDDGSGKTYDLIVKEGDTIADLISDPADGYVDETYHRAFIGWAIDDDGRTVEFKVDTKITDDITITAQFKQSKHELSMQEVTEVPTYPMASYTDFDGTVVPADDGTGRYAKWCECDKDKTYTESEEYTIPALKDEVAPNGTVYIGDKWNGNSAEDGEVLYLNGKTNFIITTSDKGDVNDDYNTTGLGIGVQTIAVKVNGIDEDFVEVYNWTEIQKQLIAYYEGWNNVPSMYQNYNANVTLSADNYAFVEGQTYSIDVRITDKAGNLGEISTISFIYDSTAPVVELEGEDNVAGDTFCEEVTIKVTEANDYTVTANGEELTPAVDENDEAIEDTYVINEAGKYQIVVTDGAGNKTTKFIEVLKEHNGQEVRVEPTCLTAGSESVKCINCGKVLGKETEIPATGHKTTTEFIDATCTEDGYDLVTCSACDLEERVYWEADENGRPKETDDDGNPVYKAPKLGHTYDTNLDGKVDEGAEGEVTKAATCVKTGTMKYTCERCDTYTTTEIAIDEDAHNFYNPVTKKPTCTEAGQVSETCKLCRETVITAQGADKEAENYDEAYAAKGHTTSTDYKVISKATCKEDGSQTKYCTVCNANIGTPVAISKTTVAHTWYIADPETDVVAPTATEKGYTIYTCSVCGATQKGDYVDVLTKYTVTFYNEDGTELYKAEEVKGTTIAADTVADPTKANSTDGKTKYTFAGWHTKKADGSYDKKYSLPMTVSGDLELYAKFTESDIIYTLQFEVPAKYENGAFTGYTLTKELMGAMGDKREPAAAPTFAADNYNTYEFQGWAKAGVLVEGDITISGDATYQAQFKVVPKTVGVIFMNGNEAIYKEEVNIGGTATYNAEKYGTPAKDYDDTYHYAFDGKWYEDAACTKEATLTNVASTKTVYAGFTATEHDWKVTKTTDAECNAEGKIEYECEACEATKTEVIPTLPHTEGKPEYNAENGMMETKCTECGTVLSSVVASSTITFLNDGGARLDRITVKTGETFYEEAAEIEKSAVKKTDEQNSYTFAGWVLQGTTAPVYKSSELPEADADAVYVATYTATARKYTVSFATADNEIKYSVEVEYGKSVTYAYTEAVFGKPEANASGHYVFVKWDTDTSNVTSDILVRPVFEQKAHSYVDSGESGATCTQGGGRKHECSVCGYYYVEGYESALGHKWSVVGETAPDYANGISGTRYYKCDRCGEEKTEEIPAILTTVNVTVKDQYGTPVSGATVRLYIKTLTGEYEFTGLAEKTNSNGVATFLAQPGEYRVFVAADGMEEVYYDVSVDENGNISGSQGEVTLQKPAVDNSCSCTCHKSTFWGAIFRFFQKIVKLFTGKPSCCAEPDSRI